MRCRAASSSVTSAGARLSGCDILASGEEFHGSMRFPMAASLLLFLAFGFLLVADAGICDDYNCLKGTCQTLNELPFFKCQCDPGWSSMLNFSFLPCGIPDCDFSMHCDNTSKVDSPAPKNDSFSIFKVCSYPICGEGDCVPENNSNSSSSYSCKCHPGYANLLGDSSGICVSNCNIGANCSQLGISLGPSASPSPNNSSTLSDNTESGASGLPSFIRSLPLGGLFVAVVLALQQCML